MTNSAKKWQRARKPEQKAERMDAILEAAGVLLDEHGLDGTGLNAIARQAGLSKPNLYVYFESREAILLRLLLNESAAWAKALRRRLDQLEQTGDVDEAATAFADTIARRRRFCTLFASVASVFEHNVCPETVAEFKREFMETAAPAVSALARALPLLSEEKAFWCLGVLVMAATGMWAHCHPAPAVKTVLAQPEFAMMKLDFRETTRNHASLFLHGVISQL